MQDSEILLLWIATTWLVANLIIGFLDGFGKIQVELENKLKQHLNDIIHRVKEEQQGDMLYWFDLDNQKFLAQGQTQEEIILVLKSRFPNHIFYLESNHIIAANTNWQLKPAPIKPN